jgi:hypothetical protein
MPRFSIACYTYGRSGFAVSLCFFLLILFFAAPAFATDPTVPEQGTADGGSALTPPSAPQSLTVGEGAIKGDNKSKLYYLPGCPEYGWVSPAQVVVFSSEEVAQQAGYHKAPTCR